MAARSPPRIARQIAQKKTRSYINADETSVKAITDFAADELHVGEIHFLPYHTLGINKYHLLNLPYDAPEKPLDAPELLDFAQQYACQKGLTATLRG